MPFTKSAAVAAAMFLLLGVTGVSTPGRALDLDRPTVTAPQVTAGTQQASAAAPATTDTPSVAAQAAADEDDGYDSLAEAVADQQMPDTMSDDLRCLAAAVYFESKGEPLSGQLAVAQVILNRTRSGRFPTTVCSVVRQSGQFSFVRGGEIPTPSASLGAFRTAVAVAQVAMNEDWDSGCGDALYFHASRAGVGRGMRRDASIGHHVFYR